MALSFYPKVGVTFIVAIVSTIVLSYFMPWYCYLPIVNAGTGLTMLNMCWYMVQRYKNVDEERDSLFPAFRRLDAKNWNYWSFVPGAITWYPVRGIFSIWLLILMAALSKTILLGHKLGKKPLTGWRKKANEWVYRGCCWLIVTNSMCSMKKVFPDYDYSEYLGKDYKSTQQLPKKASTLIVNHSSWLDQMVMITQFYPGFAASIETKKVPVLATLINNLQSIYISRGGTQEQREANMKEIVDRQELVEADPRFPQICIYAEGTQTNGTQLLSFKKGAFAGLKTVQPVVIHYRWKKFAPTWEGLPFLPQSSMQYMCFQRWHVDIAVLPPIKPNDYLFEKHADKGKDKWEIFAWAVRDAMAKYGKFEKCTMSNAEKINYKEFMTGKKNEITVGERTWTAKPMFPAKKSRENKDKKTQ